MKELGPIKEQLRKEGNYIYNDGKCELRLDSKMFDTKVIIKIIN